MKKKEKDQIFAAHLAGVLQYHQTMLSDGVRNRLLYDAISRNVTGETRFLDIGAGTGVWAILAARLGAKRVVAVEIEECLIPIIYKQAQENGVADRIEIIHGRSDDVKIRGKFDVIVSELFGGAAFSKITMESFVDLRSRFLAPGGVLIPERLALMAAPVHMPRSIKDVPKELSLSCSFFRSLKLNYSQMLSFAEHHKITYLGEPKTLIDIDFRTVTGEVSLKNLTARWEMDKLDQANAVLIFNKSTFSGDVVMNGFWSQSWNSSVYEFVPFDERSGELTFQLTLDENQGNWSVASSAPGSKPQTYAPVFAFTRVRMAQQITRHRKYRPNKGAKKTSR